MDYAQELKKATANISKESAGKMAEEVRASITARGDNNRCACGTPCRNPGVHAAVDYLTLLELEEVLTRG